MNITVRKYGPQTRDITIEDSSNKIELEGLTKQDLCDVARELLSAAAEILSEVEEMP